MTPRVLVLEGCDGCGKSSHADRLAAALRAEGHNARAFHHTKPADADPILAALDYAAQRRRLVLNPPASVIVADRWAWSTWALGRALMMQSGSAIGATLTSLATAEMPVSYVPHGIAIAALEAPSEVLNARLAARRTPATEMDELLREAYGLLGPGGRRIDTSRPADVVAAELLAWARGVLR